MGLYRTEALVLRSRKYMEADSLLTILSKKKGKFTAIAKGVRKTNSRLRGGVQIFTYNDMLFYQGRSLDIVTQSECLEAFSVLHENIIAMTAAGYWSELLDSLVPERESDQELFSLALAGYHVLCLQSNELTIRALEIKLLSLLGYNPYMKKCIQCGKDLINIKKIKFSVRQGGILCDGCCDVGRDSSIMPFNQEVLNAWKQLLHMEFSKINRLKISSSGLKILDDVIEAFLLMQMDYPLKSRPVLKELMATSGEII